MNGDDDDDKDVMTVWEVLTTDLVEVRGELIRTRASISVRELLAVRSSSETYVQIQASNMVSVSVKISTCVLSHPPESHQEVKASSPRRRRSITG